MKIYKDILEYLKIDSLHIQFNGKNYFAVLLEIESAFWILALDENEELNGEGTLFLRREQNILELPVYINPMNSEFSIYSCVHRASLIIERFNDEGLGFLKEIRNIEQSTAKWNKRKEERFTIKEDIEGIGFDTPQQELITKEDTLPCFVNNVSFSGSQIITYSSYLPAGKIVCLNLSFKNPIEKIPIKAIVRHYEEIKKINTNDKLAVISMEFEHAPLAWQQRMDRLIEYINKTNGEN